MHGLSSRTPSHPSQFSHGIEQTPHAGSHDENKCDEPPRFGSLGEDGKPSRVATTSRTPKQSSIWAENPIIDTNHIVIKGAKRNDAQEAMAGQKSAMNEIRTSDQFRKSNFTNILEGKEEYIPVAPVEETKN